ncbi:hypothetical protein LTR70_008925 [Exophiala xenobiotica]|uniref:Uncharacterized protein n=1 Tax=Lithohypha guttulata TaxID=1690604 RepID=A0ABR0JZF3_9EURO|nr:hypothetical protein LTR24_008657 [Lithohypha guttulata]KAK5311209.1 hypothetical protein LTR70_008925 [Exophiala xenobiotica]
MSRSQADGRVERHGSKRRRINTVRQPDDDNETSSSGLGSDSDSDSEAPPRTALTRTNGVRANDAEDTSSSGSSSEDNTLADQPSTPPLDTSNTTRPLPLPPNTDIHNRLTSFFSRLAEQRAKPDTATDEVIEEGSSDSGYEDDEESKHYVELDLALGVLSEDPDGEVKVPRGQEEGALSDGAEDGQEDEEGGRTNVLRNLRSVADGGGSKLRHGGKKRAIEEVG